MGRQGAGPEPFVAANVERGQHEQATAMHVAPNNVARLLLGAGAPRSLDVFKIDIDSYDIFVVEAMLRNGTFRPKVIVMEIVRFAHPPSRAPGGRGAANLRRHS